MKYFIANIGSASKKYAFFEDDSEVIALHYEKTPTSYEISLDEKGAVSSLALNEAQFQNSLAHAFDLLSAKQYIKDASEISAIGVRIVAPGSFFQAHRKIDAEYMEKLQALYAEEPLHLGPILNEIKLLQNHAPATTLYGLSDSAFHSKLPGYARTYALGKDAEAYDIFRFGYHGFSFASILRALDSVKALPGKIIVCHLGSGASIAAIQNGECIDTSMGFSPLEGLVMSTRVGDIDAGALIRLARKKGFSLDELEKYLYTECGLLGISGKSADLRELLKLEADHDADARKALEAFVYRIKKYIGAYAAALGGLDLLVFTGTIGERSSIARSRIVGGLEYLGVSIDETKNSMETSDATHEIGTKVLAMRTDEMHEMARELAKF